MAAFLGHSLCRLCISSLRPEAKALVQVCVVCHTCGSFLHKCVRGDGPWKEFFIKEKQNIFVA